MTIQKIRTFLKTRKGLLTAIALVLVLGLTAIGMTSHSVKNASAASSAELKITFETDNTGISGKLPLDFCVGYAGLYVAKGEYSNSGAIVQNGFFNVGYADAALVDDGQARLLHINLDAEYEKGTFNYGSDYSAVMVSDPSSSNFQYGNILTIRRAAPVELPPDPVKDGHTFVGWYYDEAFTQPYDGAPIFADTELYAKFAINSYTVTLDVVGGIAVEPIQIEWNNSIESLPTPERTGYNFLGWYIGDTEYTDQAITADTTLVAKWKIKTFKVTFYTDGEIYREITVDYGTSFKDVLESATFKPAAFYKAYNSAGEPLSLTKDVVEGDIELTVVAKTGWEKFIAWMSVYWWIPVAGLGALIVLGVVFGSKRR